MSTIPHSDESPAFRIWTGFAKPTAGQSMRGDGAGEKRSENAMEDRKKEGGFR